MRSRTRPSLRRVYFRIAFYAAMPVALFLAMRLFWGMAAQWRLDSVKRELAAKGISLDAEQPLVADGENPASALLRAAGMVRLTSADGVIWGYDWDHPLQWSDADKVRARAILDRQKSAFDEVYAAGLLNGPAVFPDRHRGLPEIDTLGDLLRYDAILLHGERRDSEALRRVSQMLTLSRIADGYRSEIGHLDSIVIADQAYATLERLEPLRLQAEDGTLGEARTVLAAGPDAESLLRSGVLSIEDEIPFIPSDAERAAPGLGSWWIHPHLIESVAYDVRSYARFVELARIDNWPEFHARWSALARPYPQSTRLDDIAGDSRWEPSQEFMLMEFRLIADRAGRAIPLAVEVYKSEHGRYPESAGQLVPEFFARVPVDPFSADHAPMHYRLDADGPTVWSVGDNGTDEGARIVLDASGKPRPRYGIPPNAQPDMVYGAAWRLADVPPARAAPAPAVPGH